MKIYQENERKFLTTILGPNDSGKFVRALIYDKDFNLSNTIPLDYLSNGLFVKEVSLPIGKSYIYFQVFLDSTFTTKDDNYLDAEEIYNVTANINEMLLELYQLEGLDRDNPMTVTQLGRNAGHVQQNFSGDGINTTTVTRI